LHYNTLQLLIDIAQETTVFQYAHLLNDRMVTSEHYTTNATWTSCINAPANTNCVVVPMLLKASRISQTVFFHFSKVYVYVIRSCTQSIWTRKISSNIKNLPTIYNSEKYVVAPQFKKKKVLKNVFVLCLNPVFTIDSTYCVGANAYRWRICWSAAAISRHPLLIYTYAPCKSFSKYMHIFVNAFIMQVSELIS